MDRSSSVSSEKSQKLQMPQQQQQQQLSQQHLNQQQQQQQRQSRQELFQSEKQKSPSDDNNDSDNCMSGESLKCSSSSVSNSARNEFATDNSTPLRVRDMVRKYDIAASLDQTRPSVNNSRSFYFGSPCNRNNKENNISRISNKLATPESKAVQGIISSQSTNQNAVDRSVSNSLQSAMRQIRLPRPNAVCSLSHAEAQFPSPAKLQNQSSFLNLSRTKDDPPTRAMSMTTSRDKKRRHSTIASPEGSPDGVRTQPIETSYQSKTTIAKTPNGVRIIIDIFFEENHTLTMSDVVGSRVETDIPPSKILTEFQKRAMTLSRN